MSHISSSVEDSECPYCHGAKTLTMGGIVRWYLLSDRYFVVLFVAGLLMVLVGAVGVLPVWWGWLTMLVAGLFPIGWGHFKIYLLPVLLLAKAVAGADITCRACSPRGYFTTNGAQKND